MTMQTVFPPIERSAGSDTTDLRRNVEETPLSQRVPSKTRKAPKKSETSACFSSQAEWRRPRIFDKYKPLKTLGKGQYGTVFAVEERLALEHLPALVNDGQTAVRVTPEQKKHHRMYACKVIDISRHGSDGTDSASRLADVENEVKILINHGGGHPNVQDLVDFVVEDDKAYIVSSLCRGGDLAHALELRGCLCEEDARNAMEGILNGLAHLHSHGVAHRDIKLENILLTDSKHDMSKLKIIDMGFAKNLACPDAAHCADALNTVCGTPMYIAPELIRPTVETREIQTKARYGTQADMWSCGIVLFYLLSGYPPFDASVCTNMLQLFEDIKDAAFDFSDPVWETISDEALAMIECLLESDPSKRLTAEEALRHPWMLGR